MKQFIIGTLFGIALTIVTATGLMPKLMLSQKESPLGYEEPTTHIQSKAESSGWKVSAVMRLDKSLAKELEEKGYGWLTGEDEAA